MAGRGPLPTPGKRRRNAPTIPTTSLPASGRKGRAPKVPDAYALGDAGRAWWRWAWGLPQAAAWDSGALYTIARRASLEDDLAVLGAFEDHLDFNDLLAGADREAVERVEWALSTLKRCATGSLAIEKEMRELDGKLGLNPRALADLRWTIVADQEPAAAAKPPARRASSRGHLRAVDPNAAAG